jgi:hypothetical protein
MEGSDSHRATTTFGTNDRGGAGLAGWAYFVDPAVERKPTCAVQNHVADSHQDDDEEHPRSLSTLRQRKEGVLDRSKHFGSNRRRTGPAGVCVRSMRPSQRRTLLLLAAGTVGRSLPPRRTARKLLEPPRLRPSWGRVQEIHKSFKAPPGTPPKRKRIQSAASQGAFCRGQEGALCNLPPCFACVETWAALLHDPSPTRTHSCGFLARGKRLALEYNATIGHTAKTPIMSTVPISA